MVAVGAGEVFFQGQFLFLIGKSRVAGADLRVDDVGFGLGQFDFALGI